MSSQGSAATRSRCGGIFTERFTAEWLTSVGLPV